ncbi:MAG: von Willebrand factor type A domain-containing protein [Oscillospiraceae bacterium]|nr:von Willebrand factor type A domain-containing protein [Oscillospiraceae bacterium]
MKKFRKTALFMTVVLTAVFYASCGEVKNDGSYMNYENYAPKQIYADNDMASDEDGLAEEYAPDMELQNSEEYAQIIENSFVNTSEESVSTFSIDVDTASYSIIRRMIQNNNTSIPENAVRIEEMINYFSYDYPSPEDDAPFSVTTELYHCPWNENNQLFLIGLQADKIELEQRPPINLVFLVDVSGSMNGDDRLGLVQKSINMLAENLNENDRVSIVTYAGRESVILEGVSGDKTQKITKAINKLTAGGATAGGAGIIKAYEIAQKYFIDGGNNRVLLATDGDLNVGLSSAEELTALVEEKRESGVNLSVLGFGSGNLKDARLEALADNGNGNYAYIDSELEAKKVLVNEMCSMLYTVAKDVKLQLEFAPETVQSYRLIGYENRVLANEDFNNDQVDAGEIGSGHCVTALYEIVPTASQESDNFMKLSMRYKEPNGDQSLLKEYEITISGSQTEQISKNLAFAGAVAEFGMLLRKSSYAGTSSYTEIMDLLGKTDVQDDYRIEFQNLVTNAKNFNMIPEYVDRADIPVTEAITEVIPEQDNYNAITTANDFILTTCYLGNMVDLPEGKSFVECAEKYLNLDNKIKDVADSAEEYSAQQNGIYVDIFYDEEAYGKEGKKLILENQEEIYVYGMSMFIDGDIAQLIVNIDGYRQVYELPEVIKNELNHRVYLLDEEA